MRRPEALLFFSLFVATFAAASDSTTRSGELAGRSGHLATGTVSIVVSDDGQQHLVLGDDFVFDGAPDPKLGLGNDGFVPQTLFSKLEADEGEQSYEIPSAIDPSQYNEVWIWCEQHDVPLGVARLGSRPGS